MNDPTGGTDSLSSQITTDQRCPRRVGYPKTGSSRLKTVRWGVRGTGVLIRVTSDRIDFLSNGGTGLKTIEDVDFRLVRDSQTPPVSHATPLSPCPRKNSGVSDVPLLLYLTTHICERCVSTVVLTPVVVSPDDLD